MPRARDVPAIAVTFNEVPCTTNVLGIKGAGEAGSVGSLAGDDECRASTRWRRWACAHLDMPASPPRVWAAIAAAAAGRTA